MKTHQDTAVRKQQIIDAARNLIIRKGSEHVTIREMAKAIGLTEGALYRHFKSKSDMLSFLVNDIEETLLSDVDAVRHNNKPPLQTLENILKKHLSEVEQKRGMSFQVIAEIISLGDKKLNKKVLNTMCKYIQCIEELIDEGKQRGEIRENISSSSAAVLFFSAIQGLVNIWALGNYSLNIQEQFQPVWQLFHDSIVKR
jgi:AcrR family transcriptional regulator